MLRQYGTRRETLLPDDGSWQPQPQEQSSQHRYVCSLFSTPMDRDKLIDASKDDALILQFTH
uniref:Uncharacterized protein n=1 Tax=Arundo donax TaxID=35708 RepID=A0A0A8Y339_ARUDO